MRFHNVKMVGPFILQTVDTLPVSGAEGRLLYNSSNERIYYRTSNSWQEAGSGGIGTLSSFSNHGTLEPGYLYSVDTSSGPLFGNTETIPVSGDSFSIVDYAGTFNANSFTVNASGGYKINGADSIEFTTDDTIATFIFTGNEWKVDIGGLNTGSAGASGVNFSGLDPLTDAETNDLLLIYDTSTLENKKITLEDFFKSIDKLNELGTSASGDYFLVYDSSESTPKKISTDGFAGSGGINVLNLYPENMSLDDQNVGSDYGSVFGVYRTIDFPTTEDGAVWIMGKFPSNWSTSSDLKMDVAYSMNGNDPGKTVRLQVDFWSQKNGDIPDVNSPDKTVNNDIATDSDNIGKYYEESLTSIGSGNIESNIKSFVMKLTRDVSEDAYGGTFQLISIKLYQ